MIKSVVANAAPMSVPPSIFIAAKGNVPVSPVPIKVPDAVGNTQTALLAKLCGADLTSSDLIIVDDGAGGTNKKAALSRVITLMTAQGFSSEDPTALAIALG